SPLISGMKKNLERSSTTDAAIAQKSQVRCHYCRKEFEKPRGLGVHLRKMHDKSQKENDEKGKENVEERSETMQERDGKSELNDNIRKKREGTNDLTSNSAMCHFCEREFQSARGLGVHLRRMHNADQDENKEKGERKKRETIHMSPVGVRKEREEINLEKSMERNEREIPEGKEKGPRIRNDTVTDLEKQRILVKEKQNDLMIELELRWNNEDTETLIENEVELANQKFKGYLNVELARRMGGKYGSKKELKEKKKKTREIKENRTRKNERKNSRKERERMQKC
ncbi:hypothetical protein SNEBB_004421, partial [Seison nebaliae]